MSQNIYKLGIKQQLLMLSPMILKNSIVWFIILYYFPSDKVVFLSVFIFTFFLDILPTLIVHIQYVLKNSGAVLIIDADKKSLSFCRDGNVSAWLFQDILKVIKTSSFGRGAGWYSFGEYRYYEIFFKGRYITVTCLMMNNIEKNLARVINYEEEKNLKVLPLMGTVFNESV